MQPACVECCTAFLRCAGYAACLNSLSDGDSKHYPHTEQHADCHALAAERDSNLKLGDTNIIVINGNGGDVYAIAHADVSCEPKRKGARKQRHKGKYGRVSDSPIRE